MKIKPIAIAVFSALSVGAFSSEVSAHGDARSVEFIGMDAPATAEEKADVYTKAKLKVTYGHGRARTYSLAYRQLFATSETINGKVVGGLHCINHCYRSRS
jgi:hypothetical protein